VCVCGVCVLFVDVFQDDLRCLFNPHQVNQGGVQKDTYHPPPVSQQLRLSFCLAKTTPIVNDNRNCCETVYTVFLERLTIVRAVSWG
jgi:hypothetical protein